MTNNIYNLDKGKYKLIFLYSDSKYQVEDSLSVEINGYNYYNFYQNNLMPADSFSINTSKIIEKSLMNSVSNENDLSGVYDLYFDNGFQSGGKGSLKGKITEKVNKHSVPFATISIESNGKTYGITKSDTEGKYKDSAYSIWLLYR